MPSFPVFSSLVCGRAERPKGLSSPCTRARLEKAESFRNINCVIRKPISGGAKNVNTRIRSTILRFARGFVAGGIASVVVFLGLGVKITSWEDLQQFVVAVAIAFTTGGLLAVDKLIRSESGTNGGTNPTLSGPASF